MSNNWLNRRGAISTGSIGTLLLLALTAGGIWFYLSKPFQTTVKRNYEQATEWTSENIKHDPAGYLTWALEEVQRTESKLESSVLGLKTRKNAMDRALDKYRADQNEYEKLLGELKVGYRTASAAQAWPVKVREISFDESAIKRKVVECSDKLKSTTSLVETYTKTRDVIDGKLRQVELKLDEVVKLKNRLSTDMEIARVNKSVEGIDSIGDTLNAIIDTSTALAKTAEAGTSVEEMIKPSNASKIDEEFSKILAE